MTRMTRLAGLLEPEALLAHFRHHLPLGFAPLAGAPPELPAFVAPFDLLTTADDGLKLGASYLRLLQFDVERGEFVIDSYSPLMDDFQATEWDTDNRYDGREDDVRLPIQLTSRQTSFTTDSVIVTSPPTRRSAAPRRPRVNPPS